MYTQRSPAPHKISGMHLNQRLPTEKYLAEVRRWVQMLLDHSQSSVTLIAACRGWQPSCLVSGEHGPAKRLSIRCSALSMARWPISGSLLSSGAWYEMPAPRRSEVCSLLTAHGFLLAIPLRVGHKSFTSRHNAYKHTRTTSRSPCSNWAYESKLSDELDCTSWRPLSSRRPLSGFACKALHADQQANPRPSLATM